MNFLAICLLFVALQPPLAYQHLPLVQRLFPGFHGHPYNGRDVYSLICGQSWHFWRNTGETPLSFLQLVRDLTPTLNQLNVHGVPRMRLRRQNLNLTNQILLVLIWLRKYPHIDTLALLFDIDPASIVRIIYKILPELWRHFHNQINWANNLEWLNMMGNWPEFPTAVGSIDATPHEIYRPITEPQRLFYSGHRHYHCFSTQLILDSHGHLRHVHAGFVGSMADANAYRHMLPIGPGLPLSIPPGAQFLADKAYPDGGPLLTPIRANQMRLLNNRGRRRARKFNRLLGKRRTKIEHVFKELKTFKAIGGLWRHPRWLMPVCIELCAFLAERRVRLFERF